MRHDEKWNKASCFFLGFNKSFYFRMAAESCCWALIGKHWEESFVAHYWHMGWLDMVMNLWNFVLSLQQYFIRHFKISEGTVLNPELSLHIYWLSEVSWTKFYYRGIRMGNEIWTEVKIILYSKCNILCAYLKWKMKMFTFKMAWPSV